MIHGVGKKKRTISRNPPAPQRDGDAASTPGASAGGGADVRTKGERSGEGVTHRTLAKLGQRMSNKPVAETPVEQRAGKTVGARAVGKGADEGRVFAAIDLGSSSVKMLVQRLGADGKLTTILDKKIGVTLGEGVVPGGVIPDLNMTRALDGVKELLKDAEQLGVLPGEIPMIMTAVVRNSTNGPAFVTRVHDLGLVRARPLEGPEEAANGFLGATFSLRAMMKGKPGKYATLDLGGGSFQLAVGTEKGVTDGKSTQVGSNLIIEKVVKPAAVADGKVDAALFAQIDTWLAGNAPMPIDVAEMKGRTLVGTGGVSKFLRAHFNKDVVTVAEIDALRREVGALPVADRGALVTRGKDDPTKMALGIDTPEGAVDYGKKLPVAASLLLHMLKSIGVSEVRVSDTDVRNLLISGLVDAPRL